MAARVLLAIVLALCFALPALAQAASSAQSAPASTNSTSAKLAPEDLDRQPTIFDDKDAIEAGKKWLGLIDTDKAGAAWDNSSDFLKGQVTRAKWITGLRDARKPFGKVASREAVKFARAHEMPGAPDGDYAIIEFETKFANGKRAVEHLVWMLEPKDVWRVSGYYIR